MHNGGTTGDNRRGNRLRVFLLFRQVALERVAKPPGDVSPLFAALEQASSSTPPPELPAQRRKSRWERIADDPEPFLGLGVCSRDWLERSLDELIAAETQADFEGDELVHNDVYSGNVCFRGDGAVLIDWGAAVRGSRWIDVAFALLSVRAEGASHPRLTSRTSPSSPQLSVGTSRWRRRLRRPIGPCRDRRCARI
jgi:hypothetical protein